VFLFLLTGDQLSDLCQFFVIEHHGGVSFGIGRAFCRMTMVRAISSGSSVSVDRGGASSACNWSNLASNASMAYITSAFVGPNGAATLGTACRAVAGAECRAGSV